jgi:hypothetical protein
VLAQPVGERAGLAVGQHVDWLVAVHVDQDGVVRLAATDREVIDAEHVDVSGPEDRLGADEPDQDVSAARHRKLRRQAGSRTSRQGERDIGERASQRRGPAGERRGQPRNLLGERGLPAARVAALEAAYAHDDLHLAAAEREIGELALLAGVNSGRVMPAARALPVAGLRPDAERHPAVALLDAVHHGCGQLWQKRINAR